MKPSIGRIVHYALRPEDIAQINTLRGHGQHVNPHNEGQLAPMIVCVVWPNEYGPDCDGVNGQVLLDGGCSLWVTSAKEGTEAGTWRWPERIA